VTGTTGIFSGNISAGNLNSSAAVTGITGVFSGNVTGNLFVGNGSQLTGIFVSSLINGTSNVSTASNGNVTIGIAGNAAIATFTGTGANISGTLNATGNISGNTNGFAIGYLNIPQVSFAGNATISITDAGKHYYSTLSTDNVLTIANNSSQGFQVGAAISVVNQGTGNITVAQDSGVTLYLAGNATSGNRTVATFGMATLIKVATDTWFINGTGVT
jgi:hypothetical protein